MSNHIQKKVLGGILVLAFYDELSNGENIALIVAIVALLGTMLSAFANFTAVSKTNYLSSVTSNRVIWIGELREEFIDLMLLCVNNISADDKTRKAVAIKIVKLIYSFTLKFNLQARLDNRLLALVSCQLNAFNSQDDKLLSEIHSEMQKKVSLLLKNEWEKVKFESSSIFGKSFISLKSTIRNSRAEFYEWRHKPTAKIAAKSRKSGTPKVEVT